MELVCLVAERSSEKKRKEKEILSLKFFFIVLDFKELDPPPSHSFSRDEPSSFGNQKKKIKRKD